MEVGNNVKQIAKERGITQSQIAEALGVTQAFISALYTGKKIPSLDMLLKLCDFLNVSPNTLLGVDLKSNSTYCLSNVESDLLEKFRLLTLRDKEAVIGLIGSLSKHSPKEIASTCSTGSNAMGDSRIG